MSFSAQPTFTRAPMQYNKVGVDAYANAGGSRIAYWVFYALLWAIAITALVLGIIAVARQNNDNNDNGEVLRFGSSTNNTNGVASLAAPIALLLPAILA